MAARILDVGLRGGKGGRSFIPSSRGGRQPATTVLAAYPWPLRPVSVSRCGHWRRRSRRGRRAIGSDAERLPHPCAESERTGADCLGGTPYSAPPGYCADSVSICPAWYLRALRGPVCGGAGEAGDGVPSASRAPFPGARPGTGIGTCRATNKASNPAISHFNPGQARLTSNLPISRPATPASYLNERLLGDTNAHRHPSPHPGPFLRHGLRGVGKKHAIGPREGSPMM